MRATAAPLRALGEALFLACAATLGLLYLDPYLSPGASWLGLALAAAGAGIWAAFRLRLPPRARLGPVALELLAALALGLAAALTVTFAAWALGLLPALMDPSHGGLWVTLCTLAAAGPVFLICRLLAWAWRYWDGLRRRHLVWGLTHGLLALVALAVSVVLAVLVGAIVYYEWPRGLPAGAQGAAQAVARLVEYLLPVVGFALLLLPVALAVFLVPSAAFSYLAARSTVRRVGSLAAAAKALRLGDYGSRVPVQGEDEVAELQRDFNTMAATLEGALHDVQSERDRVAGLLQERRDLVANVSHELRTPVATLRAHLEALRDARDGEPSLAHELEVMEHEVLRLQRLIDDLFALSRAEAGRLSLQLRPMDVAAVVARLVETMAPLAWQAGRVEVVAQLPPELPPALADEGRLEQILANLLRNGVRHTPPGGIVAVLASVEDDTVSIEVRDTGEGIAPEDLPHIWERYYRGPAEGAEEGAGLGLALVWELARAMGGSVSVESELGEGSRFTVRLPRAS